MNAVSGNIAIFVPHSGCPQQCSFCNQRIISGSQQPPTGVQAAELCRTVLQEHGSKPGQLEIAFFGGSFTAVSRDYMLELLEAVSPFLDHPRIKGIRISTRPDAIDRERLDILKSHGVTAIELGAQSMDEQVLRKNRRGHSPEDVAKASALIREYGFSLGLQMMTGLYGATPQSDYATAQALAALSPDTVRIYPTVVLAGTELAEKMTAGLYNPPGVEDTLPLCLRLLELFESEGIRVIRLGLHSSETMETQIVGGCYHPALGELCAGERYLAEILACAAELGGKDFTLHIAPGKLSQVLGQRKRNVAGFLKNGYNIIWKIDDSLGDRAFELIKRGEA